LGYARLCALLPNWKLEHQFLSEVPAQALQQAFKEPGARLHQLLSEARGLPEVQEERSAREFPSPARLRVDNGNGRIKLPKMGWMRYRKSQEVLGAAKNVTIRESCASGS